MKSQWYKAKVLKGQRIGHKINFPTINLSPKILNTIKKDGVFAAVVRYHNKNYPGALYLGPRLIKKWRGRVLEIHIFNFHKNIYGKKIEFQLKKFIRKAMGFKTLTELKKQIKLDIKQIKKIPLF